MYFLYVNVGFVNQPQTDLVGGGGSRKRYIHPNRVKPNFEGHEKTKRARPKAAQNVYES